MTLKYNILLRLNFSKVKKTHSNREVDYIGYFWKTERCRKDSKVVL